MAYPDNPQFNGMRRLVPTESHVDTIFNTLGKDIFGQEDALTALAKSAVQIQAGMNPPDRPRGILMLLGPSGTGKSQAIKDMARIFYGDRMDKQFKIIDCGEYQEGHMVNRILGSPNAYLGYGDEIAISEEFLSRPNMILFDEIEKADDDLPRLLLGALADGRLTVSHPVENPDGGKTKTARQVKLDFRQTTFAFTSNVGAYDLARAASGVRPLGFFTPNQPGLSMDSLAITALKKRYAHIPEFLGRFEEPVVFKPLQEGDYLKIVDKFTIKIARDLRRRTQQKIWLDITTDLRTHIIGRFDREAGARGLERTMNSLIRSALSDLIIDGYSGGNNLVAHIEDGEVVLYTNELTEADKHTKIVLYPHDGAAST